MSDTQPIDDGGPAFPETPLLSPHGEVVYGSDYREGYVGMSLSDWFAGQAMQLPISEIQDISKRDDQDLIQRFATPDEADEYFSHVSGDSPVPWKNIELRVKLEARARAALRYLEADAMLAARKEGK